MKVMFIGIFTNHLMNKKIEEELGDHDRQKVDSFIVLNGKMMFTFSDKGIQMEEFFENKDYMFKYFKNSNGYK